MVMYLDYMASVFSLSILTETKYEYIIITFYYTWLMHFLTLLVSHTNVSVHLVCMFEGEIRVL